MSEGRLKELLARLRGHLSAGTPLPGEERARLDTLMDSLGTPAAAAPGALLRLERMAVRFEASHPALAETLREIGDTLAKGGL
ncbi:MAG TPA: DUF4404 family protein [Steroidobacteraceae bacterium]|nr:DUF4404 family protein [Steroidobacteraceae bacterium]